MRFGWFGMTHDWWFDEFCILNLLVSYLLILCYLWGCRPSWYEAVRYRQAMWAVELPLKNETWKMYQKKKQCFKNPWFPVKIFSETNPLIHGTQHVLALGYGGVPVASASHRIFWEQVGTNSETGVGSVEGKAGHGTVSLQITIPQLQSQVTPLFASRLVTFGAGEYRTPNCGDLVYRHQKNHAPQLLPK